MINFYKKLAMLLILMLAKTTIKPCMAEKPCENIKELKLKGKGEIIKDINKLFSKLQPAYEDLQDYQRNCTHSWPNLCREIKKGPYYDYKGIINLLAGQAGINMKMGFKEIITLYSGYPSIAEYDTAGSYLALYDEVWLDDKGQPDIDTITAATRVIENAKDDGIKKQVASKLKKYANLLTTNQELKDIANELIKKYEE